MKRRGKHYIGLLDRKKQERAFKYTPRALTFDEFLNWEDLMCRHGFAGLRSWKTPRQHTFIDCVRLHVLAVCALMSIRRDPLSVNSNFPRALFQ
jgi:hypothetical protein